ncbi:MAG: 4Fe-4S ferredoxin [Firmicutes bacterium]|nr:4Fe-4S ferredoxin [Bacillota bacterium]
MIYYFSGTGNSLHAAKNIAAAQGEKLSSIPKLMLEGNSFEHTMTAGEILGFIFPVHSWGPPGMVVNFIRQLKINNFGDNYVFSVITCGQNIGQAMKIVEHELQQINLPLHSGFSLIMPNNYMVIAMNVDAPQIAERKLADAEKKLGHINNVIEKREKGVFELVKGPLPHLLTYAINPLFMKYSINTRYFRVNDSCNSCGICEKVCITGCIKVEDKPVWGDQCVQCLACINLCPERAIEYGMFTGRKRRYRNPHIDIEELGVN